MRVDTAKLFERLLPHVAPGVICDVGSMNGADAMRCARAVPGARVFAFEPNPYNLAPMLADATLRELGVEVIGRAVAEQEMVTPFHVLRADYSTPNHQRGRSSMYMITARRRSIRYWRSSRCCRHEFTGGQEIRRLFNPSQAETPPE